MITMIKTLYKITVFVILSLSQSSYASEFYPKDNDVLLTIDKIDIVSTYKKIINANKGDVQVLKHATKEAIQQAKDSNDTLLFGEIEAVLIKNQEMVLKNDALKTYMADLLQNRHAFDEAKLLLRGIPSTEAALMRAVLFTNLGEYDAAAKDCKKVFGRANILLASTCVLHAKSFNGSLESNYNALTRILKNHTEETELIKLWTITALADMANRLGRTEESLEYYNEAYLIKIDDAHLLSNWVDVLFQNNAHDEIIFLLKDNHRDIRLNLRYLRSLKLAGYFDSSKHGDDLEALNQEIRITELRKDRRHYDTRAEYYRWINIKPEQAQFWARKNWRAVKTPASAKLLFITSKIINDSQEINDLVKWFEENKIEDDSFSILYQHAGLQDVLS